MGDKQKVFSRNFQKMMNETFPILVRNVRIQRRSSSQDPPVRDPLGPQSERQEGIEVENGMWGCVWSTQRGRECSLVSLPPLQLQFKLTLASIRLQLRYDLSAEPPPQNGESLWSNERKRPTNSRSTHRSHTANLFFFNRTQQDGPNEAGH